MLNIQSIIQNLSMYNISLQKVRDIIKHKIIITLVGGTRYLSRPTQPNTQLGRPTVYYYTLYIFRNKH